MIIPVRCFTCNKVLADKYTWFIDEVRKENKEGDPNILDVTSKDIKKTSQGILLDKLGLHRYCCRRIMLGHVDLIDII